MTVPNLKSFRLIDFHPSDEFMAVEVEAGNARGPPGKETRKKEFIIQMFGVNEKRETCCLFVRNYQPFFFIHVGDDWTETEAQKFKQFLKNMLIKSRDESSAESIVSVTLIDRAPLYGFAAGRTSKFVDIRFANLAAFNRTKALWYGKDRFGNRCKKALGYEGYSLDLYESNLPPLLRFFHVGEISPSGWVEFDLDKVEEIDNKRTTCDYEYVIDCGDLVSLLDKNTAVPYKIASFDIEATSSHGDFPVPVKTYRKLADQVVNGFLIQQAAMTGAVTEENGKKWFRSMVMTAFGFESWSGIDSVYLKPTMVYDAKTKTTKEEVLKKKKVLEWLDALYGVDCSKKDSGVVDSVVENVLTLEKAFLNSRGGEDEDGDGDGYGGDEYGDRDVVEVGMKIITLLLDNSGKYTREFKVSELNRWMTRILPRLKGDEVSFIGTTFMEYGQTETYLNHCLVVGTCDKVEGVEIVSCDNEKDMLLAWTDLIQKENPDILTGYNIFMFDYDFMFQRAKENQCETPFLMLSRMVGEICSSKRGGGFGGGGGGDSGGDGGAAAVVVKEAEQELDDICEESSDGLGLKKTKLVIASGEYDLKYAEIRGRLQVDMFMYFRRDFQLSSYKLDDVAGIYIGDEILEVEDYDCEGEELTGLVTKNIKGLHVNDFIHVHSTEFTTDYLENGKKFEVVDIQDDEERKGKKVVFIRGNGWAEKWASYLASGTLGWGIAKDDVSPQDIFRLTCGTSADRAKVAKYCIQDCNLVHTLFGKMDVLTTYVEMSRICSVPMSFLVFRGQGIKLASYVAKKCRIMGALMPDLEKAGEGADDGYEGAIVLPPKCAMYFDNPVACNDFASLYPSIAEAYNLCPQSLVWTKTFDLEGKQTSFTGCAPPRKTRYGSSGKVGRYGGSSGGELVGEHYDEEVGYKYVDVEFDIFEFRRKTPKGKAVKTKTGTKICRWAQFPDGKKSIVPAIIHELLTARNDTKAQMKKESDMFMKNVLDKRQLGLKVTANSLYGQFGSKTSPFFQKDVAASITAIGRKMIIYVKGMVEELYSNRLVEVPAVYSEKGYVAGVTMEKMRCRAESVYGDSVANYTPVYVRVLYDGGREVFDICTIEELACRYGGNRWVHCHEEGKQDKEFCELSDVCVETWTEAGWTRLYRVIRHMLASHKKMIRVLTHTGLVDVTDDHSLIGLDGKEISPKEVGVGSELLHHALPTISECGYEGISEEEAQIMGFFFGDGSCGEYICDSGKKASWALNNACPKLLMKYVEMCQIVYPHMRWTIMDTLESSGVNKITPISLSYGSIVKFVREYRSKMYYQKAKIIPKEIIHGSKKVRLAFWKGLYDADGDKNIHGILRIDQKNQISAANIAWLASSLGWKISINTRSDKPDIYRITMTSNNQRKNPNIVKKMCEIPYEGYVYDLTTENHHFAAGVGNMIVHNTDSVFFTFNLEDALTGDKIRGKRALEVSIGLAQEVARLCSIHLPPPMKLAYEKTLMNFCLLSKKRYVGMLYETDPNEGHLKYMGLALKRRDVCDYVKDVYGQLVMIFKEGSSDTIVKACKYLCESLEALVEGRVPMDKLLLSKALRSYYKNPDSIAHAVLAERIAKRDPGNRPKPGDRVRFGVVEWKAIEIKRLLVERNRLLPPEKARKTLMMGDRIETPEFMIDKNLRLDYAYYIEKQLLNPIKQLFGLILEPILEYKGRGREIAGVRRDLEALRETSGNDLEDYMDKREKYCTKRVEELLFSEYMIRIRNRKNGVSELTNYFSVVSISK